MFKFHNKTYNEISKLSPEELVAYKKLLEKHYTILLDIVTEWKHSYEDTAKIMRERIDELEYSLLETETDRVEGQESLYDILCRIH